MTRVIIIGHGGYGSAVRRNLNMLVGEIEDFFYVDFDEKDDLVTLRGKVWDVLDGFGGEDVLFACDLAGSPFREVAVICSEHPNYCAVAGLNTAAYSEMSFNLELSASELCDLGCEVAASSILRYPVKD